MISMKVVLFFALLGVCIALDGNQVYLQKEYPFLNVVAGGVYNCGSSSCDHSLSITPEIDDFNIIFKCNRNGQSQVATDFINAVGWYTNPTGKSSAFGLDTSSDYPDKLNFYFAVDITYNGVTIKVYLGQGHNSHGNNWWIGTKYDLQTHNGLSKENGYALLTFGSKTLKITKEEFSYFFYFEDTN